MQVATDSHTELLANGTVEKVTTTTTTTTTHSHHHHHHNQETATIQETTDQKWERITTQHKEEQSSEPATTQEKEEQRQEKTTIQEKEEQRLETTTTHDKEDQRWEATTTHDKEDQSSEAATVDQRFEAASIDHRSKDSWIFETDKRGVIVAVNDVVLNSIGQVFYSIHGRSIEKQLRRAPLLINGAFTHEIRVIFLQENLTSFLDCKDTMMNELLPAMPDVPDVPDVSDVSDVPDVSDVSGLVETTCKENENTLSRSTPHALYEKPLNRDGWLEFIYREFDLDDGGNVGGEEMFALGTARRKLGQKASPWTQDQNDAMMKNMGRDRKNNVSSINFVVYFKDKFSDDSDNSFLKTMEQFLACARSLREKKMAARKKKSNSTKTARNSVDCQYSSEALNRAIASSCEGTDARKRLLRQIFDAFDTDNTGILDGPKLHYLRRNTGSATGAWAPGGRNHNVMENLNVNGDGAVDIDEFVTYLEKELSQTPSGF